MRHGYDTLILPPSYVLLVNGKALSTFAVTN